ncbi:kinesin family member 26 [Echinococcus granulosus]|uniref:Kinesin family member 26 n=1 Tax=Echinococcus granulosus TaxID=6210 RepID=W6UIW0_ECHGR|nr:kinesin family member 26 [Echinococcus granulosus]EUB60953.1 kinesin family member 26 [Echinococcus granulosus]
MCVSHPTASDSDGRRLEELKSGIFAWKRPFSPHVEDDTTELVAATMVDAAHYLDVALGASRRLHESATTTTTPGHLFFTLNVYRNHSSGTVTTPNKMEHCRLNLIELMLSSESGGHCSEDPASKNTSTVNFILNLVSGRVSPPFGTREPVLHHLLRDCLLADDLAKLSLVLHTSVHPSFYAINLELLQLTSKIQHVWKHRSNLKLLRSPSQRRQASISDRVTTSTTSQNTNLSSIRLRRLGKRMQRRRLGRNAGAFAQGSDDVLDSASDLEYTSSSEQSCTTVIYLGRSHPLRKLHASDRSKRLTNVEKKETTQKTEEKSDPVQVRSPVLSHHRRFKSRSGHKAHAGTITNELWVDGPKATPDVAMSPHLVEKSAHFGTPSRRRRSGSISERDQSSGGCTQGTVEKGVPDGKAFNAHESLERKLESRMRRLNWSNDSSSNSKIVKQLEALLTPRTDRKIRRGDSYLEARQQKQNDQMQQTSTEVLVVTNWKYDSFPAGGSGAMRSVKPFVKEWVERQNQAIVGYFAGQPTSPKHGRKQVHASGKTDAHCHVAIKTAETPQIFRKYRSHEGKKQVDMDDSMITPNDSVSHSHSLPRHVTTEILWTTQNHQVNPAVDNLSRVARWVESVSTSEHTPPALSKGCSKHPLQCSPLCKSCSKGVTYSSAPKSPEITGRGSSAPAARFRAHHGTMVYQAIEENQPQSITNPPSDSRKPDGASDPGLHRDRSFGSVSGLDTITEGLKASPLRKPVLKRFADLFVCSPGTNRRRQQQQSASVSKMCTLFFGGVGSSGGSERELAAEGDLLSIDSAGMLFTSQSKGRGGEESSFLESEQTGRIASGGSQQGTEKHYEEGQQSRLRIKEAGTKRRLGFLQSPLFSKCSPNRTVLSEALSSSTPQTAPVPALQRFYPSRQQQQQDSMAFHCQVVLENSPHTHCHHKCVSQSSSSGLGSEHSEQQSLRCHCLAAQSAGRIRRCRVRTHRTRTGVPASPEGGNEGGALTALKYTCASGGGHASSGYESVLRDDSELSSQSSSGGSYPWPSVGAKEAACQTMPCDLVASLVAVSQTTPMTPEVLTTSFTDTATVSANGDTMLASITSRKWDKF